MSVAVALTAREAVIARRAPERPRATATATTQPAQIAKTAVDQFETRVPSSARDENDAAMAAVRGALNGAGGAVQQWIEESAPVVAAGEWMKAHVAPPLDALGRWLDARTDNDTLRKSSFLVGSGLRLNVPGVNVNGGVWSTLYVPSIELQKKAGAASQALYLNYGADLESPIGGLGWGRRGKASAVVNLFFVTAAFDEKQSIVFIGIPGIFGVTLGTDVERGSYATFQNAIPLTPLWFFGPLWTMGLEVYSPLLDPVTKYVVRPVAAAIVKGVGAVTDGARDAWRALRSWLAGDDVKAPA